MVWRLLSQVGSWRRPTRARIRHLATYRALRNSPEFDSVFYRSSYRDVAEANFDPLLHYVAHGVSEGRDPSPWFSTQSYLEEHPEVAASGANPLLHAIRAGFDFTQARRARPVETVDVGPDGLPLPPLTLMRDVVGYEAPSAVVPERFFEEGARGVTIMVDALRRAGAEPEDFAAILDWGCGCGRVLRHWRDVGPARLYGCDYNAVLVEWCRANLPFADLAVNDLAPPLEYDDDSFDLVYGLSVFTHLGEALQQAWLPEIRRIVKPGGFFFFTTHGEAYLEVMRRRERRRFGRGELVVRGEALQGQNWCAAFHPTAYVRRRMLDGFSLVEHAPAGARCNGLQDFYLVRKLAG